MDKKVERLAKVEEEFDRLENEKETLTATIANNTKSMEEMPSWKRVKTRTKLEMRS